MVDEKPEVLERNDVSVFKRDVNQNHSSVNDNHNDNMKRDVQKYLENSTEGEDLANKDVKSDTSQFQVNVSDDFYEYIGDPGEQDHKTDESLSSPEREEFEDMFMGSNGFYNFKLAPEEISANAVMVEQKLDEYNSIK